MSTAFDASELAQSLAALTSHRHVHKLAFVLPLVPGAREFVEDLLAEGPPFDPQRIGVDAHEVLLTDNEAIFVFGLPDGPATLERALADEDLWTVIGAWERVAADRPRLAVVAFDWRSETRD
jgi:hypothetical protein